MKRISDVISYFASMPDYRVERTKRHLLEDIVFITIAAVVSGADGWNSIESFGKARKEWLLHFLELPNGIPSHDTFNRFYAALDPKVFEQCFMKWISSLVTIIDGEVISLDGKTIRGAKKYGSKSAIHLVSAWASANELVLGQYKVDEKSNEITAIPSLLDVLSIKGCVVTIDAMGCQTKIAEKIIEKQADYILAVKENQGVLLENVNDSFRFVKPADIFTKTECDHGRVETRKCSVINDLNMIEHKEKWPMLKKIICIESERYIKASEKTERETRYYISSLSSNAEIIGNNIRSHWGIENKLHWHLDVSFGEDHSRKRVGNAAHNFSIINRIALTLLKKDKTSDVGVKIRRLKAAWDTDYLEKILKI